MRLRPTEKFYVEDSAIVRNRKLLDTDYRSTVRSNAFTATYEFNPKYSVFAGFSYDSLFASDFVSFLRGTAPFTNLALRDQTVDRVWQGGIKLQPLPRLGINITGNYVRSTGLGEIAGELPLYGPVKFPYATGSIYYDIPQLGTVGATTSANLLSGADRARKQFQRQPGNHRLDARILDFGKDKHL